MKYIVEHAKAGDAARASLVPAAADRLRMAEAVAESELGTADGLLARMREYYSHFELRDYLDAALAADLTTPTPGTLDLWSDFAEL